MLTLLTQVTTPRTKENGEIWLKYTSSPTAKTTTPARLVSLMLLQTRTDIGQLKSVQPVVWKDTTQEDAEPNRTMNFGVPGATGTTTVIIPADYSQDAPAHPGTQMITIHIHHHALLTTRQYHQWNHTLATDPHPSLQVMEHQTMTSPR